MKLSIGNKIKTLRRERGITQEQLAESIGISFQAVSKWENDISLPDITLVPALASYFNISIDELFDFNLKEIQKKAEEICREAYKYRKTDPKKSRELLEEGLQKYPDNDILLNNLLYVMNYSNNPDETISVAGKLAEQTDDPAVKYDALRFLAYAFQAKGDRNSALAAIEQLPEIIKKNPLCHKTERIFPFSIKIFVIATIYVLLHYFIIPAKFISPQSAPLPQMASAPRFRKPFLP
ncbi:helix-turn-helix domain-containing protein [Eisenbergiella sp.]